MKMREKAKGCTKWSEGEWRLKEVYSVMERRRQMRLKKKEKKRRPITKT